MCEIYKLTCNPKLSYIRQINRNLKHSYQYHIRYIKQIHPKSA